MTPRRLDTRRFVSALSRFQAGSVEERLDSRLRQRGISPN
jgi:hypothetical protein